MSFFPYIYIYIVIKTLFLKPIIYKKYKKKTDKLRIIELIKKKLH